MQYGPTELFPHAADLPAGPPSQDAVLVTCAYLVASSSPWVMQSLFLAAIGDARKGQGSEGARGVRVPLPGGRERVRALPGAQDDLPPRLPVGLRVCHRPVGWAGGARAARARWSATCGRRLSREGAARGQGGVLSRAGSGSATTLNPDSRLRPRAKTGKDRDRPDLSGRHDIMCLCRHVVQRRALRTIGEGTRDCPAARSAGAPSRAGARNRSGRTRAAWSPYQPNWPAKAGFRPWRCCGWIDPSSTARAARVSTDCG